MNKSKEEMIPSNPKIMNYEEFIEIVESDNTLFEYWNKLTPIQRNGIRTYYEGVQLPNITSDSVFKYIFHPVLHPERLSELISHLLHAKVTVVEALPLENIRDSQYAKQIVLDILVRLEDGSLANVEIQRSSYEFTPERAAVLSASLLSRQYTTLKNEKKGDVAYTDVKTVYTIVILEKTYSYFKSHPKEYIHRFVQMSNTGVEVNLLQSYIFVELGKFEKLDKELNTTLDLWLKFLVTKTWDDMHKVILKNFAFQQLYEDVIMFLNDREEMEKMFLEEIAFLDDSTIMKDLKQRQALIEEQEHIIEYNRNIIARNENIIARNEYTIAQNETIIAANKKIIAENIAIIEEKENTIVEKENTIVEKENTIVEKENTIVEKENTIEEMHLENCMMQALFEEERFNEIELAYADANYKKQLLEAYRLMK